MYILTILTWKVTVLRHSHDACILDIYLNISAWQWMFVHMWLRVVKVTFNVSRRLDIYCVELLQLLLLLLLLGVMSHAHLQSGESLA